MVASAAQVDDRGHDGLIRLAGFAMILGLTIHIVLNGFVKVMPPEDPSLAELKTYLSDEAGTWALVHGIRYIAFLCIAIYAAGAFCRTSLVRDRKPTGWGILGLLGATLWLASALITNGIETFVFLADAESTGTLEVFFPFFYLTRVLWTAELVAWGVLILGFSVAGFLSSTIPKWLSGFGYLVSILAVLSSVFVVSVLSDGWAIYITDFAALGGLLWFACTSVLFIMKGNS
ncbi:MAG: hypothetical protein HKN20_03085 [Gemmatimonadetes bacterium]|nr:hypothetical protein [Gemmatimonadota bacterium]